MKPTLESLLSRRLLIVSGKGGTGKTTFAAALGMTAARLGIDTVVAEVGDEAVLPRLLGAGAAPEEQRGREPQLVAPHLYTLHVVPRVALTEFLELQLRVKRVARAIVNNAAFDRFLDAAPGWRELITLGKLWYMTSLEERGRARWPLLIVDAPATGHGLSFLSVPNVIVDTVKLGPLRRHTERVQELLQDSARTLFLPVTLPEELPVNETLELCARVRELGVTLGPIVANAVESPPELERVDDVLRVLETLPADGAPSLARPTALFDALQTRVKRSRMHREHLDRLHKEGSSGCVELPFLARDTDEPEGLAALGQAIEAAL